MSNLTPRGTIKGVIRSGGGGCVTDYDQLTGRPSINNELVTGDKNGHDYGLMNSNDIRITKIVDLTYGTNYDLEFPDDHVYITNQIFQPAGVSSNGAKGLVPRPSAGDNGKILSNEGWINPPEVYTPPNYSTNEQKTGQKWIDGKDIYFKTIQLGTTIETTSWFNIEPHNNIYDKVIEAEGIGTYYSAPLFTAHNDATYLEGRTSYSAPINTVVIYYTKN